ncbi:MAG: PQQ-binding-like beta-propeller repeat protein [Thermoanaerobaculia bacterium]|nr:PQQ-binding-like beta-propeller repeat protein [Thermoanaerobaculia bacterium]
MRLHRLALVLSSFAFFGLLATASLGQDSGEEAASTGTEAAAVDPQQVEALHEAARQGDLDEVKRRLDAGVPVDGTNQYGATALTYAASKGHLEVAKLLVERGADVDATDTFYSSTPAGWAAYDGRAETVRFLYEKGATGAGQVAGMAMFRGHTDVIKAILEAGDLDEDTLAAIYGQAQQAGNADVVAILEEAGAKPPAPSEVSLSEEQLQRFVGTYFVEEQPAMEGVIGMEDGALYFQFMQQPKLVLEATAEATFRAANGFPLEMTFEEGGPSPGFMYTQQGLPEPARFARKVEGEVADAETAAAAEGAEAPAAAESASTTAATETASRAPLPKASTTGNWPAFRGPNAAGTAHGATPVHWNLESGENVLFKVAVPGRGHASPVIWGDQIFLATAVADRDEGEFRSGLSGDVDVIEIEGEYAWKMISLDKRTGEVRWTHDAAKGAPRSAHHFKATQANSTPATDGKIVVAMLGSEGLFAWDMDGKLLWKKDLGTLDVGWFYDPSYEWGFSSSPILHDGKVILQADDNRHAFLAAYDAKTGEQVWKTERDNLPSWGTPTLVQGPDGMELVTNGSRDIRAYDPDSGEELWHLKPTGEVTVATPVIGPDNLIFVTARYRPIQPIYAVRPGGRGDISIPDPEETEAGPVEAAAHIAWWDPRGGVYIPTPVVYGDVLYLVQMRGIVTARDAVTGEELYKERIAERGSAAVTASPVAAGGHLYVASEDGDVYVFRHGRSFERVAVNSVGEVVMASPAVSDDVLYVRTLGHLVALETSGETKPSTEESVGR